VNGNLAVIRLAEPESLSAAAPPAHAVVFFESAVPNYQVLRQSLDAGTDAVLLDQGGDGLKEMAAFLAGQHDLTSIGIVAHGSPGMVSLGTLDLDAVSLSRYTRELTVIGSALAPGGELDLWSCEVAAGEAGNLLTHDLAAAAGAAVAASDQNVGDQSQGGTWCLDVRLSGAHGQVPFAATVLADYHDVLGTWSAAGSMAVARSNQTATLLSGGQVLVTGGLSSATSNTSGYLSSAELYDPTANTWSSAGSMATARYQQTATLLPGGKVLVAGGTDSNSNPLSSAELYDPTANTWSPAAAMTVARDQHTATLLGTGKVLVVGGVNIGTNGMDAALASTELYDPTANTWTAPASLTTARFGQTATLLKSGKLLVAGGYDINGNVLASAEIYDPATDTWSPAGSMATGRALDTATLLGTGQVLVAGGVDTNSAPLASAELYDPTSNTWSAAASMAVPRDQHTATLLGNGTVLIAGGADSNTNPLASAEIYDPLSNTWSASASMASARGNPSATLLQSGKVLLAGGFGPDIFSFLASAELYDPAGGVPTSATQLAVTNLSPTSVTAGGTVTFTLTAEDNAGLRFPGYTGTVQFTSTDNDAEMNGAPLPASYTFIAADAGTHIFTLTLATAGSQTITATDAANHLTTTTSPIVVTPGPFAGFSVSLPGGTAVTAGNSFLITAQASDAFGNAVTSYDGPTSITATATPADPQSNLPLSGTLNSSGFGYLLGNLKTAGSYTLTAAAGSFTGPGVSIRVNPDTASYFAIASPTAATTGNPIKLTVTARDEFDNIATSYSGHVHFTSSAANTALPADATLQNGVGVFGATLDSGGTQTISATDSTSTDPIITGSSNAIATRGLVVSSFTPTATGFTATFSKPFVPADVSLYGAGLKIVQDVTLVGAHVGALNGSLLIDPSNMNITFNATVNSLFLANSFASAALPDDTYTATLVSGSARNGFVDALGAGLDGANNGGHASFTTTFTTHYAASAAPVLSVPDFARGPAGADPIQVPNDSGHGIPITLYSAANVSDVTFTISYNPSLLNISGAVGGAGSDASAGSFALVGNPVSVDATHATASFHFQSSIPQNGTVVLGDIVATVPDSAAANYKAKELLIPDAIVMNGGSIKGAVGAAGIHANAYFGDVSGNGTIDGLDVATAASVAQGNSTGFTAFGLLDPAIVGDVANDFSVDAGDVSTLAALVSRLPTPVVPHLPSGLTITPVGADPTLSLGKPQVSKATTSQGDKETSGQGDVSSSHLVTLSVLLDDPHPEGSTGMTEVILALTYDPSVLSVSAVDITLGSIPAQGAGWQVISVVDPATGQIGIELYGTTPVTSRTDGSLVNIAFHVVPGASATTTSVQLVNQTTPGGQEFQKQVDDTQGSLVLGPGLDRQVVSLGADEAVKDRYFTRLATYAKEINKSLRTCVRHLFSRLFC
jgi:N-acetylneuraminic acid mutarotase